MSFGDRHDNRVVQINRGLDGFSQGPENNTPTPPASKRCRPRTVTPTDKQVIVRAYHCLGRSTKWLQNSRRVPAAVIEDCLRDDREDLIRQLRATQEQVRRMYRECGHRWDVQTT